MPWALLCNAADFKEGDGIMRVRFNQLFTLITSYFPFVLYLVFNFSFNTTVMHIISVTDFSLFCSNSARKCLVLLTECSPQKSLILLEILRAEFIQA